MYIAATVVGVSATALFVLSYQMKKRQSIILCNVISRGLYILQYLLLFAFEGAVLDLLGVGASLLARKKNKPWIKKHLPLVIVGVDLVVVGVGMLLYKNIFSLFPIVGILLHTGAFWMEDEKKIRLVSLGGSPFWLVYNTVSRAYGSSIGDILSILSISSAILRYDILKKKKKT